jgi:phosphopantothenoylcysteine decarboxylase/phosphopantothenate--cysteine ligase
LAKGGLGGKRILLGVSGGIAAYKAADLVRRLRDAGAEVRVVMTEAAQQFVTPMTFQALSGQPVRTALWDASAEAAMGHIELARWADAVVVAPASADCIARLAAGMANDLLTTLCLATAAPLHVVPAMNQQMWASPATQANVETLRGRGIRLHGPGSGSQACGEFGAGRMLEPTELVAALAGSVAPGTLDDLAVLVSAGPTYEDIDPVRFVGNRSSWRMGFAMAEAASAQGARVTLVAGPCALPTPAGVQRTDVRSAAEMRGAILASVPQQDIFISAAAVADFRPRRAESQKIKKAAATVLTLELEPTEDILAEVAAAPRRPFLVGFAAETENLREYARRKLEAKRLDLVLANRVGVPGQGFESDRNELLALWPGGERELPPGDKGALAHAAIDLVAERYRARAGGSAS